MANNHYYCVIMAGGAGTRFWPISRSGYPKQFLDFASTGKTFLQHTYERFSRFIPRENIIIVTTAKYRTLVLQQIPDMENRNLLLEPYGRNTAPCVTYATYSILKRDPEAVVVVSPADHLILDKEVFREAILSSLQYAKENDVLMTLGIAPSHPDTNFGYIQVAGGKNTCRDGKPAQVKTFTEKPDADLAKIFFDSGEFFWNAGIFVWKAQIIREELEKHLPEVTRLFQDWEGALGTVAEEEFVEKAYTDCTNISIDNGVMEKTERAWLYPATFEWYDIGSWETLYRVYKHKDENGNAIVADKSLHNDIKNNLIISEDSKKLIAVKGLDDYIVIDTKDVLLICPKDDKQFKDFISGIAMPGFEEYR